MPKPAERAIRRQDVRIRVTVRQVVIGSVQSIIATGAVFVLGYVRGYFGLWKALCLGVLCAVGTALIICAVRFVRRIKTLICETIEDFRKKLLEIVERQENQGKMLCTLQDEVQRIPPPTPGAADSDGFPGASDEDKNED